MTLTPAARLHLAGRLCRIGAWLIIAAGCAVSITLFVVSYNPNPYNTDPRQLLTSLALSGIVAIICFFFFIFLFAVGALLEYVGTTGVDTKRSERDMDDDHVEITSLPR